MSAARLIAGDAVERLVDWLSSAASPIARVAATVAHLRARPGWRGPLDEFH